MLKRTTVGDLPATIQTMIRQRLGGRDPVIVDIEEDVEREIPEGVVTVDEVRAHGLTTGYYVKIDISYPAGAFDEDWKISEETRAVALASVLEVRVVSPRDVELPDALGLLILAQDVLTDDAATTTSIEVPVAVAYAILGA